VAISDRTTITAPIVAKHRRVGTAHLTAIANHRSNNNHRSTKPSFIFIAFDIALPIGVYPRLSRAGMIGHEANHGQDDKKTSDQFHFGIT
jgi:hypothetical protein